MFMSERQRIISENLAYDDAGLFRSGIVQVVVDVTPERRQTSEGDLVLRGFIGEKEIEVIFPGRRQTETGPLLQRLQRKVQSVKREADGAGRLVVVGTVRQRIRVDGIWRVRILGETRGIPKRRFQLVAARWRHRGDDGLEHMYGHLPNG